MNMISKNMIEKPSITQTLLLWLSMIGLLSFSFLSFIGLSNALASTPLSNTTSSNAVSVPSPSFPVMSSPSLTADHSSNNASTQANKPLSVDDAFQFSAKQTHNQAIVARFVIAKGYYLYRKSFQFQSSPPQLITLGTPIYPTPIWLDHKLLGRYQVYQGTLDISIPVLQWPTRAWYLVADYQGCAQAGFCYPPTRKVVPLDPQGAYNTFIDSLYLDVPTAKSQAPSVIQPTRLLHQTPNSNQTSAPGKITRHTTTSSISTTSSTKTTLAAQTPSTSKTAPATQTTPVSTFQQIKTLLSFFLFGIVLAFTPCILPMLPILASLMLGKKHHHWTYGLMHASAYVLGMAISFALIGLVFGWLGRNLQVVLQTPVAVILFTAILILMAISLFGSFELTLPSRWQQRIHRLSDKQNRNSWIGLFVVGVLSTLILSPCVTPPLVAALSIISQHGEATLGASALFLMGLGMGLPLMLVTVFGTRLLPKSGPWLATIKHLLGFVLLGLAIWMIERILPDPLHLILWAAWCISLAVFLGTFHSQVTHLGTWFKKLLGVALFCYGLLLIVGGINRQFNPFEPWQFITSSQMPHYLNANAADSTHMASDRLHFIPITHLAQLKSQLAQPVAGKPYALVDVYADWCVSCRILEQTLFAQPDVKNALASFRLMRIDITHDQAPKRTLLSAFNVIAPPTMLFFNAKGQEIPNSRLVGEISRRDFLKHLKQIQR